MASRQRNLKSLALNAALNIFVGMIVVLIFLTAIMEGDLGTALLILVFSIICTAGISLILWLPIWYGVGYLCVALFRLLLRAFGVNLPAVTSDPQQPGTEPLPAETQGGEVLSRDQIAVINYIKKAKAKGLNREFITKALQTNGWSPDRINHAFQLVEAGGLKT